MGFGAIVGGLQRRNEETIAHAGSLVALYPYGVVKEISYRNFRKTTENI